MIDLNERAATVGALLKSRKETVAISESSAGGLICAALLSVPGASAYFLGGGVLYTATARDAFLPDSEGALDGIRSASEPYARWLAATMRRHLGSVWGLAETGASGPTGNRYGDAAGHCCLAIAGPIEHVVTLETGHGDRTENMNAFAAEALSLFERALREVA